MQGAIGQATFFTTEPRGCAAVHPFGGIAAFYDTSKVGRLAAVQSRGLRSVFVGCLEGCV